MPYVKLGTPLEEADIINRFEIRLRNERAYYAVRDLLTYYDAEQTAFSIINQYVRFVDEEPDKRKKADERPDVQTFIRGLSSILF